MKTIEELANGFITVYNKDKGNAHSEAIILLSKISKSTIIKY